MLTCLYHQHVDQLVLKLTQLDAYISRPAPCTSRFFVPAVSVLPPADSSILDAAPSMTWELR